MQKNLKSLTIGILGQCNVPVQVLKKMEKKGLLMVAGIFGSTEKGIFTFDSSDELTRYADAVIISDLAWSDFSSIATVIRSSCHVYLENACLLSNLEMKKIHQLALEAGVVVQVGLKHRYMKTYQLLKEFEMKPRIIETNRFLKYSENSTTLSVINDLMMHDIDVVLTLAGSPVKSINATGVGVIYDDPDVVNVRIEFYNGCIANLAASKISGKDVHKTRFFQNNSYYSVNFLEQSLTTLKNGEEEEELLINTGKLNKTDHTASEMVTSSAIFARELETFYQCVADNRQPEAHVTDYLNTKLVADLIVDQLERNYKGK